MRRTRYASILALVLAAQLVAAGVVWAAVPTSSAKLRAAVTVGGIMEHQREFQAIADANNNRASGTSGFDASAAYVAKEMREAGHNVKASRSPSRSSKRRAPRPSSGLPRAPGCTSARPSTRSWSTPVTAT
jgi:hypothetical protein